jgi:hypothetical protein
MISFASVHARQVVIKSICDGVGLVDPPQPHANALPALAGMNSTAGITFMCRYPPDLSHIVVRNALFAAITPFDGGASPICQ